MIKGVNIKDKLIEQVALELKEPEDWVDKIITHQYKAASEAMKIHHEVEISGFGKFLQSQSKISRRIQNKEEVLQLMENKLTTLPEAEQPNYQLKINSLKKELEFFYQRVKSKNP
jgi:nucleoid DNA-binding protein